jgi:hypothetical protein
MDRLTHLSKSQGNVKQKFDKGKVYLSGFLHFCGAQDV